MRYALLMLWFDGKRYLAGILAVAFSALLIALQAGIFWGLVGVVAVPINNSRAHIWVMYPNTLACDLARPIPNYWADILWSRPEIEQVDQYIQGLSFWTTPSGRNELCLILGTNVSEVSLGPVAQLTPRQRELLTEPGSVILDRGDSWRFEIDTVGQTGEVKGIHRARVVDFVNNMGSISGPYVLCSIETSRQFLELREDQTTYLLARCKQPEDVPRVLEELTKFPQLTAWAADVFATRSKIHWITQTKAGVAVLFVALLGLGVGASVTSQTLYSATIANLREFAVLRALGIGRARMRLFVLQQSFLIGVAGLVVGTPVTLALQQVARRLGTNADLPPWLLLATGAITMLMAVGSGLIALRSLSQAEPAQLLR